MESLMPGRTPRNKRQNLCLDTIRKRHLSYETTKKTERILCSITHLFRDHPLPEEAALLHRYIDSLEGPNTDHRHEGHWRIQFWKKLQPPYS